MKLETILTENHFPQQAIDIFLASGIKELYPPQVAAVNKGLLQGKNVLMSVPTAAGKTLLAELCMLKSILLDGGRCLYIAPLKALASEKYNDFKKKYASLGINVGIAIGDLDSPSSHLNRFQILVATAEKVDSLLRSRSTSLIQSLKVVVVDEIHFINDGLRGPTMEILIARMKQLNPNIQFLALSATVSNAKEMAAWLNAELITSTWRPIPLKEGVFYNDRIQFHNYGTRLITEEEDEDLNKLTLDTLRGKGQVLVFVNSRRSAQAAARQVSTSVAKILPVDELKELTSLAKKLAPTNEATKVCRKLAEVVVHGVAFHHAGLKPQQRELIEENFKKNLIKVICCTPTLAAGVNLPARRAIIRDCKRFESGIGAAFIPTSEYKQCAGRAGRPQFDDFGEAVLMAKSLSESQTLFDKYIHASPEPVISKLSNQSALRIHVLASIAGGYVNDVKSMLEFITHTFLYQQRQNENLLGLIGEIFDFLLKEGFVTKSGFHFFATPLGSLTSRLYIDPLTAMTIREALSRLKSDNHLSHLGFLHALICAPDATRMNVGKKDIENVEKFAAQFSDEWIFTPENYNGLEELYDYLATLKTTWMLLQWIEEEKEDTICETFDIGPGDVYRHVESIQWLLYAAWNIASLMHKKMITFELENLRNRIQYGIKNELLDLIQLKGVGRIRARNLYNHGYTDLPSLKYLSVDELGRVSQIGKTLAQDILNQLRELLPSTNS